MRSLKSRIVIWVFLPSILVSVIDLVVTYRQADQIATLVQQQMLKGSAQIISEQLSYIDGGYELSLPPAALEMFAASSQDRVYYAVHSAQGMLISGTDEIPPYPDDLKIENEKFHLATLRGEPVRVIAYAHSLPTMTNTYAITQVAQTLHSHDAFRQHLFWQTMRAHLLLLSVLVIALFLTFRWTLKPVKDFGRILSLRKPISLEKLDEGSAPEELALVIHSMNDYVVELDKTLNSNKQFVANTAHHLRTSFAILASQINYGMRSGALNTAQKELFDAILKTTFQGTKVINQLLVLAAVEQHRQPGQENDVSAAVNMATVITSVIEERAPMAHQKRIEIGVSVLEDDVVIAAPAYLIREVVSNLVDNSIQHMQQPGAVSIALHKRGSHGVLSVIDTGPGIPEIERLNVFGRFYRLDHSKPNSSGLGLAIVREICDSLFASIELRTPENGIGLQVDIQFPLHTTK